MTEATGRVVSSGHPAHAAPRFELIRRAGQEARIRLSITAVAAVVTAATVAYVLPSSRIVIMYGVGASLVLPTLILLLRTPLLSVLCVLFLQVNDVLVQFGNISLNKPFFLVALAVVAVRMPARRVVETAKANVVILSCLAALVLLFYLSALYAPDPWLAVREGRQLLNSVLLSLLLASSIDSVRELFLVIVGLIVASVFLAVAVLAEYGAGVPLFGGGALPLDSLASWDGVFRPSGTSLESVPMVATMLLGGAVLAFVLMIGHNRWRAFFMIAAGICFVALFATITRSVLLSAILVLMASMWRLKPGRVLRYVVPFGFAAAVLMTVVGSDQIIGALRSKVQATTNLAQDPTVLRRYSYLIIGLDLVSQRPILGIGAGNFPVKYSSDAYRFVPGRSEETRPLHNQFLQYAAETGAVGLSLFVAIIGLTAFSFYRAAGKFGGLAWSLVEAMYLCFFSVLLQMFFLSSKSVLFLWVLVGLSMVVRRWATFGAPREERGSEPTHRAATEILPESR